MIKIDDKRNCCGCSACYNACPQNCIIMLPDKEGFLYPLIDLNLCTDCKICEKVCPELDRYSENIIKQKAFLVQHKDEKIRLQSTSGGAFSAIAEYVISKNGVVFGVAFNDTLEAIHTYVENIDDLHVFRNSKYVQSKVGKTFSQVKHFLNLGRLVCFSGTPCQIEGLLKYLNRDYESLITVDFVCRAVPSPLILEKYIQMQKNRFGNEFSNIMFRDKHYGYKYSTLSIFSTKKFKIYHEGVESDPYLRSFFSNISVRPACYKCSFKKRYRKSDFTLWDCFTVDRFNKQMDDDKGTTRILTHSNKANIILLELANNIHFIEIDVEKVIKGVREMFESIPINPQRDQFFVDLIKMEPKLLFDKYFPRTFGRRLERILRIFSVNMGVYRYMKKFAKIFYKNKANKKR